MKKWLWLLSVSLIALGCQSKDAQMESASPIALPTSAVDTPPPTQLWEEDPDYQEVQAGGKPNPPIYDSLGRRLAPVKVTNNPPTIGKTPGKGSDPRQTIDPKILEQDRLRNQERMRIHDSIQKAKEKPLNVGK